MISVFVSIVNNIMDLQKCNIFLSKRDRLEFLLLYSPLLYSRIQEELSTERLHLLNSEKKLLVLEKDKVFEEVTLSLYHRKYITSCRC